MSKARKDALRGLEQAFNAAADRAKRRGKTPPKLPPALDAPAPQVADEAEYVQKLAKRLSQRTARKTKRASAMRAAAARTERAAIELYERIAKQAAGAAQPAIPATPTTKEGRRIRKITEIIVARARIRRQTMPSPFELPQHPPNVGPTGSGPRLAFDEGIIEANAWAAQAFYNGAFAEGTTFLGYAYLAQLAQRPEYRRPAEVIATEATRKWIKLQSVSDPKVRDKIAAGVAKALTGEEKDKIADETADKAPKLKELTDFLDHLRVRAKFREISEQDSFFGRAHLYLDTGQTDERDELVLPIGDGRSALSRSKVSKRRPLVRLQTVEAVWTYPSNYNSNDPLKPDWYNPQQWFVQGKELHASRLLRFIAREVPDLLKPAYSFGGLSMSQMGKPYVDNWLRTRQSVSDLVSNFSVSGIKTDLGAALEDAGDDLFARIDLFNALKNNSGLMALQSGAEGTGEEFFNVTTPLGSLDLLQAQAQEHQASVWGIPLIKMLGIQPAGLNASSEGEIETFDDNIGAYQEQFFRPNLTTVIAFAQLSLWGKVDPAITYIFEPLQAMTPKEKAEIKKIEAETDGILINDCGSLSPEESRKRIAADPDTPYASLDVDDMPEPPEQEGQENGLDADADAEDIDAQPSGAKPDPGRGAPRAAPAKLKAV